MRLIAKEAGNLLSVALDREISLEQLELVKLLIDVTNVATPADYETLKYDFELARDLMQATDDIRKET